MKYYEDEMTLEEGTLCVDFANTLDWHASANPVETLKDYPALVQWSLEKNFLSPEESNSILAEAARNPQGASQALGRAVEFREAVYRILVAAIRNEKPDLEDLRILDACSAEALPHRKLILKGDHLFWTWEGLENLTDLLWPVIVSALDLITSSQLHRVGQCADDRGCGWLFLDLSRNRSRQWCSMESCGNRAKARRHYQRAQTPA